MAQSISNGIANAFEFAFGVNGQAQPLILASSNTGTGAQTYIVELGYSTTQDGRKILPLFVNASLTVGTGANAETVVVTAASASNPQGLNTCTFTATFANAHSAGEIVSSRSNGLQEAAADWLAAGGGLIALTPAWFRQYASHAAGITALTGFKSLGDDHCSRLLRHCRRVQLCRCCWFRVRLDNTRPLLGGERCRQSRRHNKPRFRSQSTIPANSISAIGACWGCLMDNCMTLRWDQRQASRSMHRKKRAHCVGLQEG